MGACHTHFRQNQKVRVMFKRKSRAHYIGKFKERRSKCIVIDDVSFRFTEIRAIVIER
jgi:hypothetical protein